MPRKRDPREWRRWWRELEDRPEAGDASERAERLSRHRPPWWPENEPWPPHWRGGRHHMRRPFLRRLGCLFVLFNIVGAAIFVGAIVFLLDAVGLIRVEALHFQAPWLLPLAGLLLAMLIASAVAGATSLRRVSGPLDDLLAASQRVAEGDYAARVVVRGPGEVRSLSASFNAMAEKLDAHDQQQRAMLADVTHELRTPLTIIQGNVEGMLDGVYAADEPRLRSVLEETRILSRLIDDLRTLSQAESGTLQLRREPLDLGALLREAVAAFRSQADAQEVRLELAEPVVPVRCNADPERIRQVLGNLLSNALRYSPRSGMVSLQLTVENGEVRISVTDAGPGIPAADLPHVFDRYYKTADSRGMGLGLSIARYIVEAHGGRIWAESADGGGTSVRFTLPA